MIHSMAALEIIT